ncbi:hypothetical protein B0H13DRAFT_1893034 [Mycena leptocephala]|nr:hypothetical protein B0H13DRAFT_1893034 [Mycena leptocephala]
MSRLVGKPSQHEEMGGYGNGKKNSRFLKQNMAAEANLNPRAIFHQLCDLLRRAPRFECHPAALISTTMAHYRDNLIGFYGQQQRLPSRSQRSHQPATPFVCKPVCVRAAPQL